MKIGSLLISVLLSFSIHAQLGVIDAEEGADLMPDIDESSEDNTLETAKKDPIHYELAKIVVESQMAKALIKQRIESGNPDLFRTTNSDLSALIEQYTRYSRLVNSLSSLYLQHAIDEGASEIESESIKSSNCTADVSKDDAKCDDDNYIAVEKAEDEGLKEVEGLAEIAQFVTSIASEADEANSITINDQEQRNLIIITMTNDLKRKADNLQSLIDNGLVEEISLKGLATVKKSFAPYQKVMGEFVEKVSEFNEYEVGTCDITPGESEFYCFDRRYVLETDEPVGQTFSRTITFNDSSRGQRSFTDKSTNDPSESILNSEFER